MLTKSRFPVKPYRVAPRSPAPFGAGIHPTAPLPAEPVADEVMPKRRVRWERLELSPLPDEGIGEPEAELTLSGNWQLPGEEHSWDFGH